MYHSLFMIKWLMRAVLPGVAEVMASFLRWQSMLIRLDFPTLLRPMNAYSGLSPGGHWVIFSLLFVKSALWMSISLREA